MPRGTPAIHQWPYMAPMKRESAERKGTDHGSGTLMTLVGNLMPSASVKDQWALFSEVERQFSLPRLPVPQLDDSLRALRNCVHPGIEALPQAVLPVQANGTLPWREEVTFELMRAMLRELPRRWLVDGLMVFGDLAAAGRSTGRWEPTAGPVFRSSTATSKGSLEPDLLQILPAFQLFNAKSYAAACCARNRAESSSTVARLKKPRRSSREFATPSFHRSKAKIPRREGGLSCSIRK